jgi:hypothetical protein
MRAKKEPVARYFCGVPRQYDFNLLSFVRMFHAGNENEALFMYLEERTESLAPGDEVVVIEAGPAQYRFVLMADEELPVEEVEADND